MNLTKAQRAEIFKMFDGLCAYCGCQLPDKGWHVDHIEPVDREWWKAKPKVTYEEVDGKIVQKIERQKVTLGYPERDVLENMYPACRSCNLDKRNMSLDGWRKWLEHKPRVLRENSSAWRHAERFGLVQQVETKVVFYFEKFQAKEQ